MTNGAKFVVRVGCCFEGERKVSVGLCSLFFL